MRKVVLAGIIPAVVVLGTFVAYHYFIRDVVLDRLGGSNEGCSNQVSWTLLTTYSAENSVKRVSGILTDPSSDMNTAQRELEHSEESLGRLFSSMAGEGFGSTSSYFSSYCKEDSGLRAAQDTYLAVAMQLESAQHLLKNGQRESALLVLNRSLDPYNWDANFQDLGLFLTVSDYFDYKNLEEHAEFSLNPEGLKAWVNAVMPEEEVR